MREKGTAKMTLYHTPKGGKKQVKKRAPEGRSPSGVAKQLFCQGLENEPCCCAVTVGAQAVLAFGLCTNYYAVQIHFAGHPGYPHSLLAFHRHVLSVGVRDFSDDYQMLASGIDFAERACPLVTFDGKKTDLKIVDLHQILLVERR
jgi:hypothetical protein